MDDLENLNTLDISMIIWSKVMCLLKLINHDNYKDHNNYESNNYNKKGLRIEI